MEQIVLKDTFDTNKEQEKEKSKAGATIEAILFPSSNTGDLNKHNTQTDGEFTRDQNVANEAINDKEKKVAATGEKGSASCKTKAGEPREKKLEQIPINQIVANPNQPRQDFSQAEILKLADSIRQYGVIQPITVRKTGQLYELIAGERRLRALKELNWELAPCIVAEISEEASAEIAIIENLMRQDLNIFEQASAIQALIDTYGLTQEQVAEKLSSSQSYIANKLRLLRLTQEERDILLKNRLTERHARALLRVNDQNLRKKALNIIVENELNVSATEELISGMLSTTANSTQSNTKEPKRYKDALSFYNALKTALNCAKASDIGIKFRKIVGNSFTEITISIPNSDATNGLDDTRK